MSNTENNISPTEAKPMKVGQESEEIQSLKAEISQSGVAQSEADVERLATPETENGGNEPPSIPLPIITRG